MKIVSKTYFGTTCHVVTFEPSEVRLEPVNGIPNQRESIHKMWGNPQLSEVTSLKANGTFFNGNDPKSEMIGAGRGDAFLNVAWDGSKFYMEPEIPTSVVLKGFKEVSSSYALTRYGQREYTNESLLKTITGKNPRMMMGQKANGQMVFIAAEGRRWNEKGLSSEEERSVCCSEGLRNAVNNDGGGSTVLVVDDSQLNKAYDGRSLGYIWAGYRKWRKNELPTLKRGSKGMWVNLLQRMLGVQSDGVFGGETEKQVKSIQRASGLKVDGQVGPITWAMLCSVHGLS